MNITYAAPNRPIHYHYARAIHRAGCLKAFVSAFPRFSSRAAMPELGDRLMRRDQLQCLYLASRRWPVLPATASDYLAWASKKWLDYSSFKPANKSDVFLFYNGCGLQTMHKTKHSGLLRIVEVVNSHVLNQDEILREEHRIAGVAYEGIYPREIATRTAEYDEADFILCPSEFVRDSFLARGWPVEKLIKNTFGFEQPSAAPTEKRQTDKFRVLYVGSLSVRKGLRYILDAFGRFRHPRKELWIVGPKHGASGIEGVQVPEGVAFKGVLKGAELAAAYHSASVFVLPSVEEGLALVMGEALSYGLPVIATENSGARDLFTSGTEGFIVPVRDPLAIAVHLQQLADEPALRNSMGSAARSRADTLAGWNVSGERLVGQISEALQTFRAH
jgi:alpha-maltose-1-phosphate synthase